MHCTNCGKVLPDGSAFCTDCGEQVYKIMPDVVDPQEKTPEDPLTSKYHFYYGIYKRLPRIIAILYAIAVLVMAIVVGAEAGIGYFFLVALIGAILVAVVWFLASLFVAPKVVLIDTVLEIKKNMTKK